MSGGDPATVPAVAARHAAVQDEGSQLCAIATASAPVEGRDELWLDLCAGPGGKTALLAALAAPRGARVVANELRPHRAELVRAVTAPWRVEVQVGDARQLAAPPGAGYDRVLVDAPCTGLGALRRRPEARWRRTESDLADLARLQRELLQSALRLARPGGVVAYVTCSPHLGETRDVIGEIVDEAALIDAGAVLIDAGAMLIDAGAVLTDAGTVLEIGGSGAGPGGRALQLWPHRHGTDAMFCALIRS